MIILKCDVCGGSVKPAETQAQANRNLGLHKRTAHDIKGRPHHYIPVAERRAMAAKSNPEGEDPVVTKKAIYQRNYRRKLKARGNSHEITVNYCPHCGCNLQAVATGIALAAKG